MAVLINLLPDSKQKRLHAQQVSRFIIGIGLLILAIAVVVPIILFTISQTQRFMLSNTQKSLDNNISKLNKTKDLQTMLTTKDHLASLPELYNQRTYPSHYFGQLPTTLPLTVRLSAMELSQEGAVKFTGVAATFASVQQFVAALNASIYTLPSTDPANPKTLKTYQSVTLDNVSADSNEGISFVISSVLNSGVLHDKAQ